MSLPYETGRHPQSMQDEIDRLNAQTLELVREIERLRNLLAEAHNALLFNRSNTGLLAMKIAEAIAVQPEECLTHWLGEDGKCSKCGHWFHPARTGGATVQPDAGDIEEEARQWGEDVGSRA